MENKVGRRDLLKGSLGLGLAGVGVASGLAAPSIARAAEMQTVNIVNSSGTSSLVEGVLFKKLKLFEKYGVNVNILNVSDGSKILAALIGGSGDMCGGSGFGGLFPAIKKGATIKVISGANIAPGNVIYANNDHPEIKSIADLPGHTLGTGQVGALLYILAAAVMQKYKVDYSKVKFVNVGSSTSVWKALVGKTVECGVAPVQYMETASDYGVHLLDHGVLYEELPDFTNQAMYASNAAIANKREGLTRVLAAYCDMFRWIGKPENKAVWDEAYREALGSRAKQAAMDFSWKFYGAPGRIARGLVLSDTQVNYVQDLNITVGIQDKRMPLTDVVDMSMAEAALKLVKS